MLTTGSGRRARALRTVAEIDRLEAGIASMQTRWWEADANGESVEFINRALHKAFGKLAEAQAQLAIPTPEQTKSLVRRFAAKPLNKGTEQ